jgi:hypothetical protein
MLDPVSFNSAFVVVQEMMDSDASDDLASFQDDAEVSSVASGSTRSGRNGRKNGGHASSGAGDLRKKLLKSEQAKSAGRKTRAQEAATPAISRLGSPAPPEEESRASPPHPQNRKGPGRNVFFTNTAFYTLLRLIEVTYYVTFFHFDIVSHGSCYICLCTQSRMGRRISSAPLVLVEPIRSVDDVPNQIAVLPQAQGGGEEHGRSLFKPILFIVEGVLVVFWVVVGVL